MPAQMFGRVIAPTSPMRFLGIPPAEQEPIKANFIACGREWITRGLQVCSRSVDFTHVQSPMVRAQRADMLFLSLEAFVLQRGIAA